MSNLKRSRQALTLASAIAALFLARAARAQENYEIQVYGSELIQPGATMVELHSNYTADGLRGEQNGVLPNRHAFHETLEITRGFTSWFETGAYLFTSIQPGRGWEWVGSHIRPRVSIPESWHWPVGLSLSAEVGYARRSFSEDTWTVELRPIIDKKMGRVYVSINPTFERSLHGFNSARGFEFSPSGKFSVDLTKALALGVEYYSGLGPVRGLDSFANQQHMIIPVVDLEFSPRWEFNFGVGVGLNHSTDAILIKMILGRRF